MSTLDSFIKQWSKTPASNGTTPNVVPYGWPENQAPSSVNNCARQQMADHRYQWEDAEWFARGETVSKASGTTFKIATDVTADYLADRRIKIFDTTTKYATVVSSSYSAPDTTITLQFDNSENSLGASFTAVALSILSPTNTAIPRNTRSPNNGKNLIIGGNFDTNPWQRSVSVAAITNGTYVADRFAFYTAVTSAVCTVKLTADAPTLAQCGMVATNCLHVDCTTADGTVAAGDYVTVATSIEGYNWAQIAQRTFTLSFWVKSTKTGTFCVAFRNSGSDRSYVAEYTVIASGAWEYKTITVTASPSAGTWNYTNGIGIQVIFTLMGGSTYQTTAGAWQTGNFFSTANQVNGMDSTSNDFKLDLIQIETGTVASAFELEDRSLVLEMCQRYFEKSYTQGIYPGATLATGSIVGNSISTATGAGNSFHVGYKVTKRAIPSITFYSYNNGTAGSVAQDDGSDLAATTSVIGDAGFTINWTNGVGRYEGDFHFTASAEL